MTIGTFLKDRTKLLKQAGIATAQLDCLVLLEDVLKLDRALVLAHPEKIISAGKLALLNKQIIQRSTHVPLAYIRGRAAFYGREFTVNKHVLVPRPESEAMIEMLKKLPLPNRPRVADIGTGTGCLGVTAALEITNATVHLYDIDKAALHVARTNSKRHGLRLPAYQSDLLQTTNHGPYDLLLANLPYVPEGYEINQAARHEPYHALFAGSDGLDLYRCFWQQIHKLPQKPAFALCESLPAHHGAQIELAETAGYRLLETQDFIQGFRLS